MKRVAELIRTRQWAAAEARLAELRGKAPFDPQVLFALGFVHGQQGRVDEAVRVLRQCLGAAPGSVQAMVTLSVQLLRLGQTQDAVGYARMAVGRQPNDPVLHYHLSLVWDACRNAPDALQEVDHALRLRPRVAEWMLHRMRLLAKLGQPEHAADEAERLRRIPGWEARLEVLQLIDSFHAERSDWARLSADAPALERAAADAQAKVPPSSLMMWLDDPDALHRIGVLNAAEYAPAPRPPRTAPSARTVIAYCTADVREHPVAHMLLDVLPLHDRTRFEVVLIRLAPADGSEVGARLAGAFDRELDLTQDHDAVAARRIREAGIDVLIDLMGQTKGNRLALLALRPCPAQILWLGCPVTTGCAHVDAFIVDGVVAPPDYARHCSEPLVRLPCCYHPISHGLLDGEATPMRSALGIPEGSPVVGLLQQPNRIRPQFIEGVARALAAAPDAHLVMRVAPGSQAMVRNWFAARGVDAARLHLAGRWPGRNDYLGVIRLLDVFIDSHPYGGHSTAGEALALGTPVLTCAGRSIHARVAASMMHEMGLADLVMPSPALQEETLGALLRDPALLQTWKQRFSRAAAEPAVARRTALVRALEAACVATLAQAAPPQAADGLQSPPSTAPT